MKSVKQLEQESYDVMKGNFGYTNKLSAPHLTKIVISVGTGSGIKKDRNRNTLVVDRLTKITGQKAALRSAKKSVASFKLREGEAIGVIVTLRGKRMYDFMDKLIKIAFPRTKDFRGIPETNVDSLGNMTTGIKEHTIFPEIQDEELKDVFSLAISIVTTAKSRDEALTFFKHIGMPFKKADANNFKK
jgi:large subunit ribosomal protein L5